VVPRRGIEPLFPE